MSDSSTPPSLGESKSALSPPSQIGQDLPSPPTISPPSDDDDDEDKSSPPPTPPNSSPPPPQSPPPTVSSPSNSTTSPSPPPQSPPQNASPPPPSPISIPESPPESPPPPSSSSPPPLNNSPPPPLGEFTPPPSTLLSTPPPSVEGGVLPVVQPPPPPPSFIAANSPPTPSLSNPSPSTISPPMDFGQSSSRGSSNTSSTAPSISRTENSDSGDLNPTQNSNGDKHEGVVVGATVASVFIIAMFAIFFVVSRRTKKRMTYAAPYMAPTTFSGKSDGFFYGQSQMMGNSGLSDPYYYSQGNSVTINSYGSQRNSTYTGERPDLGVISNKVAFSYEEVMEITKGFSRQNILGEGGFGCVFKGWLSDGKVVAVKQLKAGSGQGEREFRAEVEIISRVHHRHLVSLVGYCIAENQRLLIYEFVENSTLEHHLHGIPVLDWANRVKISIGSAKGLAYLHEDCHPKIIHRDIKSANILLGEDFEAQVADFGLAKLNDTTQTHVSTRVMGTFGYMAPEYASSGKLTDRSDVFSFGVVLLELITGRKPVDQTQPLGDESLVEWARPLLIRAIETGDPTELVDPRLERRYVESEMLRMIETAAACVRHSAPKRPRMVQVVRALDNEAEMSDLTNGVKYGHSTAYDSGQYNQDIMKFRRMALGSDKSAEFSTYSGDYTSKEGLPFSWKSDGNSGEYTSGGSETRLISPRRFGQM